MRTHPNHGRRTERFEAEADDRPCSPGARLAVALAEELALAARAIGRDEADEAAGSVLCPTRQRNLGVLSRKARACIAGLVDWSEGREPPLETWMLGLGLLTLDDETDGDAADGDEGHAGD